MTIHESLPIKDYFSQEAASSTGLKLLRRSAEHYKAPEPASGDTRAKQIGTAIHAAILEPEHFARHYLVAEADDRVSAFYKGLAKDVGGDRVLTRPEHRRIIGMQASAYRNKRFAAYMEKPGRNELSVFSTDPVTGVPVKCRFDRIGDTVFAFDLKKCQDARQEAFERAIGAYGYYMQNAFYRSVWEWETGERLQEFPLVALEEDAPHGCILHDLDEIALELGRKHFREGLETYARCLDRGEWPSYQVDNGGPLESVTSSVPAWMANELLGDVDFGGV